MGRKRLSEDRIGILQIRLPEVAPLPHARIFASHAVDQDVEPLVFAIYPPKESFDVGLNGVVQVNRDCRSSGVVDGCGGFVDRLGTFVRGRVALHAASCAIHGRTGLAERPSDAASGSARRTSDNCDTTRQRLRRNGLASGS
jgi:hypothetical protein